jgi:serine protease Do
MLAIAACSKGKTTDSQEASMAAAQDLSGVQDDITQSRQNAITRAVERVSPAVVGINVIQIRRYIQRSPFEDDPFWGWFFEPRQYMERVKGLGSGFLISPDGFILTNEHVVHQASEILVTTTDGKQYQAKSVGEDFTTDVALLKIDGNSLPFIPLGDSDDLLIGEWVIALGNPFGLFNVNSKPTVTVGVISAKDMDFQGDLQIEGHSYQDMIQTDASINGGNSGGPLVNSLGSCIGINTFIISGSDFQKTSIGIGFAIPINQVKKILSDLKSVGRVDRSFFTGLEVENINMVVARMLGISPRHGVIVSHVAEKSPADKAGIRIGDVVVAINGERVQSTTDVQTLINTIDVTEKGTIRLTLFRKGKQSDVELKVDKNP